MKNKRGGSDSFKGIVIGAILITLFTFLILTFATDVTRSYGKNTSQLEEGTFSLEPYEEYLDEVESDSQTFQDRLANSNIFSVIAGIVVTGIFSIAVDMVTLVIAPFTLLAQILNNVLGVPPLVTTVVLGIVILSILFAIWRLIKIGE